MPGAQLHLQLLVQGRGSRLSGGGGGHWHDLALVSRQVRSISINVRKNLAFNTLSQELLLKEFSTIS